MTAPELTRVRTPDGASLALYRYRARADAPRREPVLLVSGFGLNGRALDFDEASSWTRMLADAGFEAWLLELRGSGRSSFARWRDGAFDDYLVDAGAAVEHVLRASGAERLHWVGYSLGGMLLYAWLTSSAHAPGAGGIRSAAAVEAPVDVAGLHVGALSRLLVAALGRAPVLRLIPYRRAARLLLPVLPRFCTRPLVTRWMNLENLDQRTLPALLRDVIDNVPVALAAQLLQWIDAGRWTRRDGSGDYLAGLARVRTPVLVVTGSGEFAGRAAAALRRLPADARGVSCTRAAGCAADYGHADLLFGRAAPAEVFPHVRDWLERHDGAAAEDQLSSAGSLAIT